jgi:hypothetical protein
VWPLVIYFLEHVTGVLMDYTERTAPNIALKIARIPHALKTVGNVIMAVTRDGSLPHVPKIAPKTVMVTAMSIWERVMKDA